MRLHEDTSPRRSKLAEVVGGCASTGEEGGGGRQEDGPKTGDPPDTSDVWFFPPLLFELRKTTKTGIFRFYGRGHRR